MERGRRHTYSQTCQGVGAVRVGSHLLAADQYSRGTFRAAVTLPSGLHAVRIRVRVKVQKYAQ